MKTELYKLFGEEIPLCLVIYNRQCLIQYSEFQNKIINFINEENNEKEDRTKIVKLLLSVNTDADYMSRFFKKNSFESILSSFTKDKLSKIFKHGIFITKEAVDKIVSIEETIRCHYYFSYQLTFY